MSDRHKRSQAGHGVAGPGTRRNAGRVRHDHPRAGDLMLVLRGQSAAGHEHQVAKQLAMYLAEGVAVLHTRRIPGSRETIDHLAIAPSGVWVVGSDGCEGKVALSRPSLRGRRRLLIDGRDASELVDRLTRDVELVARAIPADVPVHGALCFADGRLPVLGRRSVQGHALLEPRGLAGRIDAAGTLTREQIRGITLELARRFPRA